MLRRLVSALSVGRGLEQFFALRAPGSGFKGAPLGLKAEASDQLGHLKPQVEVYPEP